MSAKNTVIQAFKNACMMRQPNEEFMFHSDRGVQYACNDFAELLQKYNTTHSLSRKGNCWNNAVAESFFKTIKVVSICKTKINTDKEAYSIIFDYIDGWYHTLITHSALNGLAPIDAFILKSNYLYAA